MAAGLGVDALGGEQVLDAERNAFERPRLAGGDAAVGLGGHGERLLRRLADIGVEAARRLDRRDVGTRELGRGEALGGEPVADFGDGERGEVGHGAAGGRDRALMRAELISALFAAAFATQPSP